MVLRWSSAALLCACMAQAAAQDYPRKPVRLIVPFAPGGGNDTVARTIAQQMSASLGQQIVIDNRSGAGGVVGAELAAKAPPDGYTLFLGGVGSLAVNPNLHARLPYDPLKDFAPITLIASAPSVLVVHPSVPARTLAEFTALARANPGKLNYASNGNGSSAQLAAVMYEAEAARGHGEKARQPASRRPDRCGIRLSGLRSRLMVRTARAGRHAARNRR